MLSWVKKWRKEEFLLSSLGQQSASTTQPNSDQLRSGSGFVLSLAGVRHAQQPPATLQSCSLFEFTRGAGVIISQWCSSLTGKREGVKAQGPILEQSFAHRQLLRHARECNPLRPQHCLVTFKRVPDSNKQNATFPLFILPTPVCGVLQNRTATAKYNDNFSLPLILQAK